ncbi:MAG: undecaprenyl diphosphate synthase family protein, partial [Alphaproteobacteria bacterium]|nr:undecaprenyl diphosphate synthase family protein [Alphaproteobacteria bacterium]
SFEKYLDTHTIPDPDLFIRTSGEKRISNYLLWQIAYTELVFSDVLWPDFTEEHFEKAVYEFKNRERRYGLDVI